MASDAKKAKKLAKNQAKLQQAVRNPTPKQQKKKDKLTAKRDAKDAKEAAKKPPVAKLVTDDQEKLLSLLSMLGAGQASSLYPQMFGDDKGVYPEGAGFQQGISGPAMDGFSDQSMQTIADRFSSFADGGQFRNIAGAQRQGLETDLSALNAQFDQTQTGQQQNFLATLLGAGLQRQFEPVMQQMGANPWLGLAGQTGGAFISRLPGIGGATKKPVKKTV